MGALHKYSFGKGSRQRRPATVEPPSVRYEPRFPKREPAPRSCRACDGVGVTWPKDADGEYDYSGIPSGVCISCLGTGEQLDSNDEA